MANWNDLYGASFKPFQKQVGLFTGEISSLVWEPLNQLLSQYDLSVPVDSPKSLGYGSAGLTTNLAYVTVNPDAQTIAALATLVRSGAPESVFILADDVDSGNPDIDYLKKKAQQYKMYYTVNPPKAESARTKMISIFMQRWSVSRESAYRACALLDFSPGKLFMFDKMMLLVTGGRMLPSSKTQEIIDELLGTDSENTVVSRIVAGQKVDLNFGKDFTDRVLRFLYNLLINAKILKGAFLTGNSTVSSACTASGLSQFMVLQSWPLAENYDSHALSRLIDVVEYGMKNNNPETLSVISRVWR